MARVHKFAQKKYQIESEDIALYGNGTLNDKTIATLYDSNVVTQAGQVIGPWASPINVIKSVSRVGKMVTLSIAPGVGAPVDAYGQIGTTATADAAITFNNTIPAGYNPKAIVSFLIPANNAILNAYVGNVVIKPDGSITIYSVDATENTNAFGNGGLASFGQFSTSYLTQ